MSYESAKAFSRVSAGQGPWGGSATRDSQVAMEQLLVPQELKIVFQLIVDLQTASVFAQEALVRCSAPEFASPPALFDKAAAWHCNGRLGRTIREIAVPLSAGRRLFINVHPEELNSSWLVRPDDPLFAHDQDVFIEVTEAMPLPAMEKCRDVLREVRSRPGIYLAVDDLGCGYSNLKTLADLEPQIVKLDRGLISGIDKNARQRTLVKSIVRMCRELGAEVIAEGIETTEEMQACGEAGIRLGQGFLFGRPAFPSPRLVWPSRPEPQGG